MTFEQYWTILLKRWRIILICFLVVGLGAYIGSKLMTPIYQSTALVQIAIPSGSSQSDYNSLLASDQLVDTEATLATSDTVLREVASHYPGLSVEQLSKEVTAASKLNTQLFEIDVQDPSPTRAAALANDVAATLIKQQLQLTHQARGSSGDFLFIAQAAQPSLSPVRPNKLLNTGVGLVFGLLLGMLLAVVFEQLDTRVRTPEALTELLDWPVLATIWRARSSKKEDVFNPSGHDSNVEGYRILRTNIGFSGIDKPLHSLMVTGAVLRDGKSTIAANLAIFMAKAGKTTLLIDADLRHPALHDLFGLSSDRMGLSNAVLAFSMPKVPETPPFVSDVAGTPSVEFSKPDTYSSNRLHPTAVQPADALTATRLSLGPFVHSVGIPNLWVMPSGPLPPNPPELLESKAMQRLFAVIANYEVEVVIFDTPPVLGLSDVSILASKMDGTLVVADITRANKKNLKQMKAVLMQTGAHVLGCVVNKQRRSRHDATYYSYYYQTDEQNGKKKHIKGKKDAPAVSTVPINVFRQPEMQNGAGDYSPQDVNLPGTTTDEADAPTEKREITPTRRKLSWKAVKIDLFSRSKGRQHESRNAAKSTRQKAKV
jgi:Mrp family chromosome partitioning ATPase